MSHKTLFLLAILTIAAAQTAFAAQDDGILGRRGVTITATPYYRLEPKLSFRYDPNVSQGWMGAGWRIDGVHVIERVGAAGHVDTFSLDGAPLAPCADDVRSYSCKMGGTHVSRSYRNLRIERDETENLWILWSDDGVTTVLEPLKNEARPERWAMANVRDTLGRRVEYTYACDSAACRLHTIEYGDTVITFFADDKALRSVDVRTKDKIISSYELSYVDNKGQLALQSVETGGEIFTLEAGGSAIDKILAAGAKAKEKTRIVAAKRGH